MSTSQRVVILCDWGVKAGMACLKVKLCVAIELFRKYIWYLKALYKCPDLLFTLLYFLFRIILDRVQPRKPMVQFYQSEA